MLEISAFHPWDLDDLEIQDNQPSMAQCLTASPNLVEQLTNTPFACTASDEAGVILVAGVYELYPGVAECWGLIGKRFGEYSISIHRKALDILETLHNDYGYYRLQMMCQADFKEANRWARMLGFKEEGVMRRYGIWDTDYVLYAKIQEKTNG